MYHLSEAGKGEGCWDGSVLVTMKFRIILYSVRHIGTVHVDQPCLLKWDEKILQTDMQQLIFLFETFFFRTVRKYWANVPVGNHYLGQKSLRTVYMMCTV